MASTQVKASTAPFSPLQYQKPKLQKKFMLSLLHHHSQNKKIYKTIDQKPKLQKKFMLSLLHHHSQNKQIYKAIDLKPCFSTLHETKNQNFHELLLSMA
jgi:hypothetical protein